MLPSGDWDGFYTYAAGPEARQHTMPSRLNFTDGLVSGGGSDDVG